MAGAVWGSVPFPMGIRTSTTAKSGVFLPTFVVVSVLLEPGLPSGTKTSFWFEYSAETVALGTTDTVFRRKLTVFLSKQHFFFSNFSLKKVSVRTKQFSC